MGTTGPDLPEQRVELPTPAGPAAVTLTRPDGHVRGLVLLGHGAGGGVRTPDLLACRAAFTAAGLAVGLVEQPYRVAGKRVAAPAARLDEAWLAVVAALCGVPSEDMGDAVRTEGRAAFAGLPLVVGGRSSGARVACRTARASGAVAVLALGFPLRPPWRPETTRLPELAGAGVPVLAVQGERDRFGGAVDLAAVAPDGVDVLPVAGADHGLGRPLDLAAITGWVLTQLDGGHRTG